MAVTDIQATVSNLTGVSPSANTVEDAQRFVVSSVPKNLLKWAATFTVPGSHGGNTSQGINIVMPTATDSILDVSRNGFSATEVPYEMKGFIDSSASLYKSTNTYPKYYLDNAVTDKGVIVIVKPAPTDAATAIVLYVDFTKIDDDCDLRNAVIYRASAAEFEKLATSKVTDWSDLTLPVAPPSPSFGSDLSISSSAPVAPILSDSTVSFSTSAPTYVKPTSSSQTAFNDYWTIGDFPDSDPSSLSITAVPPATPSLPSITSPGISSVTISNVGVPPTYTSPGITSAAGGTDLLDILSGAPDNDADQIDFSKWWDVLADYIESEEDSELAQLQIGKISTYLQAYSQEMQNQLNIFNDANAEYQGKLQEAIQQAQINVQEAQKEGDLTFQASIQDYTLELQKYQADVGKYQAEVAQQVQEYTQKLSRYQLELNTVYQSWAKTESDNLAKYQADIQNELNSFNDGVAEYQAQLQISVQDAQLSSQDDAQKIQKYSAEVGTYQHDMNKEIQDFVNTLQKESQEYQSKVALYNSELQKYQAGVSEKTAKVGSATQNAAYYSKEADKYYQWANAEVQMYIQNNSKMINKTIAAQAAAQQQRR